MKQVENWEGYRVTECGNVIGKRGTKLVGKVDKYGYRMIILSNGSRRKSATIHRLVAQAYIPNPYNLATVNHKDGNKLNNHVDNLEWMSNKDNLRHAFDTGLCKVKGEDNPYSKLTNDVVSELYLKYKRKEAYPKELSRLYGMSLGCIEKICYKQTWKHITDKLDLCSETMALCQ